MDAGESPEGLSPAEAFALLGHEHRVDILQALLAASREGGEYPTPFASLHERTDIEVSSQFSYHLDALTGQFVRETDAGYELRYAGWEIVTSILAGTYNERVAFGPTAIPGTCPRCGEAALSAQYREEWLTIACQSCDHRHTKYPMPPGAVQTRDLPALLDAFDRHVRTEMNLARDGICPGCTGVMAPGVDPDGGRVDADRVAIYRCRQCGNRLFPPLGLLFVEHDAIVQLFAEQGQSVRDTRYWELAWCVSDDPVEVVQTDPWRCELSVTCAEETRTLTIAPDMSVVATRRDDTT